jgi:RHS repeat-associated protein
VWTVRYHGLDGHGNTRYLTDALGDITDTYDYDAFGNLIAQTGSTPNNFLFTSEQLDPDLGLYFLRARYQDTTTGRFWTMDEFEGNQSDPLSLHKYTFNHSEPVNRIDPSGLLSLSEIQVAFGINTMNAIRRAINIYRAYNRASSIIDFINSVQGVANLMASGGLSEIEATFREISTTSLGRRYRFSANMVVESLERNSRQIIQTAITDWSLGLFKAFQRGARINRFVVYMPLPPFKAGIPGFTLPTGIKVGDYPLALRFGGPRRASGRLLGVGIELRRGSGPDLRQVFRMDYHKPNPGHPNTRELGYWEDPPFHYHVNKFDRSQEN